MPQGRVSDQTGGSQPMGGFVCHCSECSSHRLSDLCAGTAHIIPDNVSCEDVIYITSSATFDGVGLGLVFDRHVAQPCQIGGDGEAAPRPN